MNDDEAVEIRKDFREAVNRAPSELEEWLETEVKARALARALGG